MKLIILIFSLIAVIVGFLYFSTTYRSAFEADQQCHYEMRLKSVELNGLGCDHDLETNQWLLYRDEGNDQPSQVLKRFRY